MDHLETVTQAPMWTFGGGTVLMLRLGHRLSKDIDLFVPDPQYLGYLTPRLSDAAEAVTGDYVEQAEFIKLFLPEGEIDIVVGTPLTDQPFDMADLGTRHIRVETCAEIIAKKMWYRGDRGKARDLFDLCAVADAEPQAVLLAAPFLAHHAAAFLTALKRGGRYVQAEFEAIDALGFRPSFADCIGQAREILGPLTSRRA
ncbi:MAG: nucleotidyl transferase AbiEii/AbiGii toxin family protein [Ramlibacter sp.]|nr:nucleotidyl transferase AbiEii/AbiGii toxin family protein [Ramlibacter sp.]